MFTDLEIQQFKNRALEIGLSGAKLLDDTENDVIREVCNGIGPAYFPEKVRMTLNRLMPRILLLSVIHDLRYWSADGSYEDFTMANAELSFNGWLMAWKGLPWWDLIRKAIVIFAAERCAALCSKWGWRAYCAAVVRHREWLEKRLEKLDLTK